MVKETEKRLRFTYGKHKNKAVHKCLFLNFLRTYVLFVGQLIPLFWTSGDVSSGFQNLGRGVHYIRSLRFSSGETPADLFLGSRHGSRSLPHMRVSAEVGCQILSGDPAYRSDVLTTRLPRPTHCLTVFNVCYVVPDTNQTHDPYKRVCFLLTISNS